MSEHPVLAPGIIMTDDDVLTYSQQMRRRLVDDMTKEGMPTDKGETALMLNALADMDRVALTNKKMGNDEKQSEADRTAAMVIAKLAGQFNTNPFATTESVTIIEMDSVDLSALPEIDIVPGHMDIGSSDQDYKSFIDQVEGTEESE